MPSEFRGLLIGYARTSTIEQEAGLEAQVRDLEIAGCGHGCGRMFKEQCSSIDSRRPALRAAIDYAREGDIFVVTKLDRLARSVSDFVDIQRELNNKGVALRVLGMNLDTATPTGKLMVNMLVSVAQFERELMLERQREGIAKAKSDGKYKGRAPTARRQAETIRSMRAEGRTVSEIVATLGVSRASVFRMLQPASE